jgi:putative SOS response-associated peptidase YedK
MPVILAAEDYDIWLDPNQQDPGVLIPLLRPFGSDALTLDPVGTYVNSPKNEGPRCVQVVRELL